MSQHPHGILSTQLVFSFTFHFSVLSNQTHLQPWLTCLWPNNCPDLPDPSPWGTGQNQCVQALWLVSYSQRDDHFRLECQYRLDFIHNLLLRKYRSVLWTLTPARIKLNFYMYGLCTGLPFMSSSPSQPLPLLTQALRLLCTSVSSLAQ